MQVTLSLAPQKHFNVSRSKSNIQNSNEGVGGYERGGGLNEKRKYANQTVISG